MFNEPQLKQLFSVCQNGADFVAGATVDDIHVLERDQWQRAKGIQSCSGDLSDAYETELLTDWRKAQALHFGQSCPQSDARKMGNNILIEYKLIKTTRRLTFDILSQAPQVTYMGDDDGSYMKFTASNGYEVISRSRMDIQTERIWLLGAKHTEEARSGSMVFSSNEKRDAAYDQFVIALNEWAKANGGIANMEK